MPSLCLPYPLDLSATLMSGQTFCWTQDPNDRFSGWIDGLPLQLHLSDDRLHWDNPAVGSDNILRYFCLDLNLPALLANRMDDPWLSQASQAHPGLRPVREERWECLVNFLCSSLKQIVQIRQINARLRASFGSSGSTFPTADVLAEAGEKALRTCALGYRARHVSKTAKLLSRNPDLLIIPPSLPTYLAARHLEQIPGVGPKISRCVLLYAYSRWDAFPVDVWVDRLVRELYFPRRRKPFRQQELEKWSLEKFGQGCGLAQLRLFHWFRTRPDTRQRLAKGK